MMVRIQSSPICDASSRNSSCFCCPACVNGRPGQNGQGWNSPSSDCSGRSTERLFFIASILVLSLSVVMFSLTSFGFYCAYTDVVFDCKSLSDRLHRVEEAVRRHCIWLQQAETNAEYIVDRFQRDKTIDRGKKRRWISKRKVDGGLMMNGRTKRSIEENNAKWSKRKKRETNEESCDATAFHLALYKNISSTLPTSSLLHHETGEDYNPSRGSISFRSSNGSRTSSHRVYRPWRAADWVDQQSPHLGADFLINEDGSIGIKRSGIYFVYSQIVYNSAAAIMGYELMVDDQSRCKCVTGVSYRTHPDPRRNESHRICYTALVIHIEADQKLWLNGGARNRTIRIEPGANYLGLVLLF